jgi:hypothetical protein
MGYPTEFADSTQNHHKIIGTPVFVESKRMKILQKKPTCGMWYLKSLKGPKIRKRATRRNSPRWPQI